ncbi:MAG: glycosyltransferase [Myxococcota bacterium]|nr:glycosyltransferase [Myxococcota bacterium]
MSHRILVICTPLSAVGGSIRRLRLWANHLGEHAQLGVLCNPGDGKVRELLEAAGAEVLESRSLGRPGRVTVLPGLAGVHRAVRAWRPDAVVSMFVWANLLASSSALLQGLGGRRAVPHVVHLAGDPVPPARHAALVGGYRALVGFAMRRADRIVTINGHDADLVRAFGIDDARIRVIPIGIEGSERCTRDAVHRPLRFGVVARLSAEKRVDRIVEAFAAVTSASAPAELHVYGSGVCQDDLESQARSLGVHDRVTFHGWAPDPRAALENIDVLLLYSDTEGTPRSMMEAGDLGVPSVGRDVGGVAEIIDDGRSGFVVRSEEELRGRMRRLLDMPPAEVLAMGRAAHAFMRERHSIEREVGDVRGLIDELVG